MTFFRKNCALRDNMTCLPLKCECSDAINCNALLEAYDYGRMEERKLHRHEEPVKPEHVIYLLNGSRRTKHYVDCGSCSARVYTSDRYCRNCGTEIDWSEPIRERKIK